MGLEDNWKRIRTAGKSRGCSRGVGVEGMLHRSGEAGCVRQGKKAEGGFSRQCSRVVACITWQAHNIGCS